MLEEFFRVAFRQKFYESVRALQADLDEWLRWYNNECPHRGYGNMDRMPMESIRQYLSKLGPQESGNVNKET